MAAAAVLIYDVARVMASSDPGQSTPNEIFNDHVITMKINALKCTLVLTIVLLWVGSAFVFSQTTDYQTFRISQHAAYLKPRVTLHALMLAKGNAKRKANHFCVLGYRAKSSAKSSAGFAWVYWQEQKAFILWEPWADEMTDLTKSRRYLKMPEDFVRSQAEINGSTYLETWQWADDLIATCRKKGDQYKFL